MSNIEALNIIFENGENIIINHTELDDFYISNIDSKGEEIPYEQTLIRNKLYANFCMLKINNTLDYSKLSRIKKQNDIIEIQIVFSNQTSIKFDIASDADPFSKNYHNNFEYIIEDSDYLGLLLSEYNIKYKENLFA